MNSLTISLLLLLSFFGGSSRGQLDPGVTQSIDDFVLNRVLPEDSAVGLSLAVVTASGDVYTQGYGMADLEDQVEVTSDTRFLIGSATKSFTALVVVKVLSEKFPELGSSALDTPIRELLPTANFTLGDRYRSESVTFRDLLSHRICTTPETFSTMFGLLQSSNNSNYIQRYAQPVCGFRTDYVYNNGYLSMAGDLAGLIAGSAFPQLSLFDQLGMTDSWFLKGGEDFYSIPRSAKAYIKDSVDGPYIRFNSGLFQRYVPIMGAGGIATTSVDMTKYIRFHLNIGKTDEGTQLVSQEAMGWFRISSISHKRQTFRQSGTGSLFINHAYTLGLHLGSYNGWEMLNHVGYIPPFNSQVSIFPSLGLGLFTTSNGPGRLNNLTHSDLHLYILDLLQGATRSPQITNNFHPEPSEELQGFFPSPKQDFHLHRHIPLKDRKQGSSVLGHYGHPLSGELDVVERTNSSSGEVGLFLEYGVWGIAQLLPKGPSLWSLTFLTDITHDFNADYGYLTGFQVNLKAEEDFSAVYLMDGDLIPVEVYERDLRVGDLPSVPYDPNTCGDNPSHTYS